LSRESVSLSGVFLGETTLLFFVDANIVDVDFLAERVEYFIFDFVPRVRGVGLFFLEFGDFGVDFFDLGFEGAKFLVAMLRFLLFTLASSLYGRLELKEYAIGHIPTVPVRPLEMTLMNRERL
jgi:hypothetical protein